jgi:flagellar protein FlaG
MDIRFDPATHVPSVAAVQSAADAPSSRRNAPAEPDRAAAADASVEQVVTQLQDHVQSVHRELRFKVDENTGQTVVRVVDQETGRLIRQIPNQNVLDLNAFLQSISGLLLREQA